MVPRKYLLDPFAGSARQQKQTGKERNNGVTLELGGLARPRIVDVIRAPRLPPFVRHPNM